MGGVGMSVSYLGRGSFVVRNQIKSVGGVFDGVSRTWEVSDHQMAELEAMAIKDESFAKDWAGVSVMKCTGIGGLRTVKP